MAQNNTAPKIPNIISSSQSESDKTKGHTSTFEDEDTDPNIVVPQSLVKKSAPVVSSDPPSSSAIPKPSSGAQQPTVAAPTRPGVRMPDMGAINDFMKDPSITEIMVNDVRNIIIEKSGKLISTGVSFGTLEELNRITRNILDITGRILSPEQPYIDTSLPDGSRVNIIGPPLTILGPSITIRKFPAKRLNTKDLIAAGAVDQKIAYFLSICVIARLNIIVSGGTGSGKTTLLNVLGAYIPKDERIIAIEDTPELFIQHVNSVRLQTKPPTPTSPAITIRDLVANSLRMRPDRILIGEVRKGEAFDMLIAMNTGHSGSMTTIHANSPRDAIMRLETLCMLSGTEIPMLAIKKQIASAIDLIVQIKRFKDGSRKIISVTELTGMEGETITAQDIFEWDDHFKATGFVPTFVESLREQGFDLPPHLFS